MIAHMMMQAAQRGMTPERFFQQYAGNPQVAQIANIAKGKTGEQIMQTVSNMASQRGTSIEELSRQMGIPLQAKG